MDKCGRCGEPVAHGQGFQSWTENNLGSFNNWFLCQVCQRKLFYFFEDKELSVQGRPAARVNG